MKKLLALALVVASLVATAREVGAQIRHARPIFCTSKMTDDGLNVCPSSNVGLTWRASDCSAVTTGVLGDTCQDSDDHRIFVCTTSTCNASGWSTSSVGATEWADEGTILRPGDAADDWLRISGDATGPRVGSTAGNDIQFDPDNDGTGEASIDNAGKGTFDSLVTANKEASDGGNYLLIPQDNNDTGTPFAGVASNFGIGDVTETGGNKWCAFDGVAKLYCFPVSTTTTHALFATATSGEPGFRGIVAGDLPAHSDAGSDTTTWVLLGLDQAAAQTPRTDAGITYNSSTDTLSVIVSALSGSVGTLAAANTDTTALATTSFVQQEINNADGTHIDCASGVCNVTATGRTRMATFNVEAPTTAYDGKFQVKIPDAATLVRVSCSTSAGSSVVSIYERAESSPNTGTTNMLTGTVTCNSDTTPDASTSFTDSAVAADAVVALGLTSTQTLAAGDVLRVFVEYTVNQ